MIYSSSASSLRHSQRPSPSGLRPARAIAAALAAIGSLALPLLSSAAQAQSSSNPPPSSSRVRWTPRQERGNAQGTLSGGRRGAETDACGPTKDATALRLLVPSGRASLLTTQAQPTLAWQVTTQQPTTLQLIVRDVDQATPLLSQSLSVSQTGLVSVSLPASAALSPGQRYRWTVIAQCPDGQKTEIYARSFIQQVSGESLEQLLLSESAPSAIARLDQAARYAEQGIWYDTLASLLADPSQLAEGQPTAALAELLEEALP